MQLILVKQSLNTVTKIVLFNQKRKKKMANSKTFALLAVCLLAAAIMIPIGMQQIVGTSTTGWNSAVVTLWQVLLPVLMIIGIAILFIPRGNKGMAKHPLLEAYALMKKMFKDKHAVGLSQIIMIVVGFVLAAIATPVAMNYLVSINSTFNVTGTAATYSAVYTIFSVLLPVLYMIGVAIHFIPRGGK